MCWRALVACGPLRQQVRGFGLGLGPGVRVGLAPGDRGPGAEGEGGRHGEHWHSPCHHLRRDRGPGLKPGGRAPHHALCQLLPALAVPPGIERAQVDLSSSRMANLRFGVFREPPAQHAAGIEQMLARHPDRNSQGSGDLQVRPLLDIMQ